MNRRILRLLAIAALPVLASGCAVYTVPAEPVVYGPAPVYAAPAPVVVAPAPPVYYATPVYPSVSIFGRFGYSNRWRGDRWRGDRWHHRR